MGAVSMIRLVGTVLAAAGAAVLAAESASGAPAVGSDVSSNWGGYVVSAGVDSTGASDSFTTASGTWVQPAARCGRSSGPTSSAFWVGLGGDSPSSSGLEQVGTEADCTAAGNARYSAWYELVPAASVKIGLKVAAGDRLSGSVAVQGTRVTVKLANLTSGKTFSRTLTMASPDTTSAEWIVEAPSLCATADTSSCRQTALTDFGKVTFSHASATTASGHTGTISDAAWSATALELDASRSFGPGFGFDRYAARAAAAQAVPGALRSGGASFSVIWRAAQQAAPPGYGPDPGDGYAPGYGFWPIFALPAGFSPSPPLADTAARTSVCLAPSTERE